MKILQKRDKLNFKKIGCFFLIVVIFIVYLFVNCTGIKKSQTNILSSNLIVVDNKMKLVKGKSETLFTTSNRLKNWIGKYEYFEFIPPDINLHMFIEIYQQEDKYYANININGFHLKEEILASVVGDEDSIEFLFLKSKLDCPKVSYQENDVLFKLWMDNKRILTDWGKIEPFRVENFELGKKRFEKIGTYFDTSNSLDDWIGKYEYSEFCPPNITFNIEIEIYKEKEKYFAEFQINGFQILEDFVAKVIGNENEIYFIYYKNNISQIKTTYFQNEILIRFRRYGEYLLTDWKSIKPYIIDNQSSGNVRFQKIISE